MEYETKHTAGPWQANGVFPSITAIRLGEPVHIADAFYNSFGRPCDPKTEGEAMANARLIAAAPELLACCKTLFARIEDGTLVRDISKDSNPDWGVRMMYFVQELAALQAAILKAEGK